MQWRLLKLFNEFKNLFFYESRMCIGDCDTRKFITLEKMLFRFWTALLSALHHYHPYTDDVRNLKRVAGQRTHTI